MSSIRHSKSDRVRTAGKINSETWETEKNITDVAAALLLEPDFPDTLTWNEADNWIDSDYSEDTTVFTPENERYQLSVTERSYGRHFVDFIYFEHPNESINSKISDYREKI